MITAVYTTEDGETFENHRLANEHEIVLREQDPLFVFISDNIDEDIGLYIYEFMKTNKQQLKELL